MSTHPFFAELKSAREARGITLAQISDVTRIAESSLEAIERGNIAILPQAYVRAFIREYADTVGLDPVEVMRRYDAMITGTPEHPHPPPQPSGAEGPGEPAPPPVTSAPEPTPSGSLAEKLLTARAARMALGVAVVAAAAVFLWNILGKSPPTVTEEIPFQSVLADRERKLSPAPSPAGLPPPSPAAGSAAGTDSLTLRGLTSDTVWVMVSADQLAPREFIFKPNVRFTFKAKNRFSVTLGNAGAVTFTLNQKELGMLGKPGAVVRDYEITRASLGAR
jgi:cytoskeletal protein RodZ